MASCCRGSATPKHLRSPPPMIAMVHATKADGGAVCEQTVDATSGVEATELYPDVKFVTVQEYVNADRRGKATTLLQPISGVIVSFLNIMKHRGYIKNFEVTDPHRVGKINVELHGRIKDCKALTYRQDLRAKEIEQYRVRMLPTPQWGYVVITTPNGVLDHEEAIRQNVGGQVLGYFH